MYRVQMKPDDPAELAIWRKCEPCKGLGARIIPGVDVNHVVVPREACTYCHGFGRQATFIPIDQLANPDSGIDSLALVRAIKDWLANQPELTAVQSTPTTQPDSWQQSVANSCHKCGGKGYLEMAPQSLENCQECGGTGIVPAMLMCAPCNGTGEVQGDSGPEVCSGCNGSGAVS